MESSVEYLEFFRFRTPTGLTEGVHKVKDAIKLIDFSIDSMLDEAVFINRVIPGCFSYDNLRHMKFSEYEKVLSIAKEINDKKSS